MLIFIRYIKERDNIIHLVNNHDIDNFFQYIILFTEYN